MKTEKFRIDEEPKFSSELSKIDLIKTLNWYHENKIKETEKYTIDFFKKKYKIDVSNKIKNQSPTLGFICRIVQNGGILPKENQIWLDSKILNLRSAIHEETISVKNLQKANTPSIQERLADKIQEIAGELEGMIDEYIQSGFKKVPSPYSALQNKAKGMHATKLIEIFKKHRNEFDSVLNTTDSDIKEGYSNFSKADLKKLVAFCDLIISDCMKISDQSVVSRKPRKRKAKSADQIVSKMNILDKFDELNLVSISPKEILGANQLWVFNVKTRKLGCYHADDISGLHVKGSSIVNYSESKSIQKKVRKPEVLLPEFMKGGKVFLRNVITNIRAVESPLSGRINKDTILLKVIK